GWNLRSGPHLRHLLLVVILRRGTRHTDVQTLIRVNIDVTLLELERITTRMGGGGTHGLEGEGGGRERRRWRKERGRERAKGSRQSEHSAATHSKQGSTRPSAHPFKLRLGRVPPLFRSVCAVCG